MLHIKNTTKIFNKNEINEIKAIDNLSLDVHEKDFVCVIGSNGSGKTTLLNLISGNIFPDDGNILFKNRDITRLPDYKRAYFIGRVFQNPEVGTSTSLSIAENVLMAVLKQKRKSFAPAITAKRKDFISEKLALLDMGFEKRLNEQVKNLSMGQRQALSVLMASLTSAGISHDNSPKLLLLDEHTSALDPNMQKKVLDLTTKVVEEFGLTTLMVSHNIETALKYGNKIIMLDKGQIIFSADGDMKSNLSLQEVIEKFKEITKKEDAGFKDSSLL